MTSLYRTMGLLAVLSSAGPVAEVAARQSASTGLEWGGVPAVNFDSDEGFGYGVITELYQYGDGGRAPYEWTVQPTVFLTTEGRRDATVFFDAPHLLPDGWRLTAFVGTEKQIATPYYGVGNATVYDEALEADDGPDPYYYRFGRTRDGGIVMLQKTLPVARLRFLVGGAVQRTRVVPVPEGEGTTLFAIDFGAETRDWWSNDLRAGFVYDSRDRETGPRRGTWTELLVQRADERFGADFDLTRVTFTDRRYVSLTERLVLAHRVVLQQAGEGGPVHELFQLQTSFKQQEGLGGSKTVRGVLRNRYVGRGLFLWNVELRLRAAEFSFVGRDFHAVLSGFVDRGRVWAGDVRLGDVFDDLHSGYGGGLRVGMGENFVVALDLGTSAETGMQMYIGLGYLF